LRTTNRHASTVLDRVAGVDETSRPPSAPELVAVFVLAPHFGAVRMSLLADVAR
jgi:hypothetical protein